MTRFGSGVLYIINITKEKNGLVKVWVLTSDLNVMACLKYNR